MIDKYNEYKKRLAYTQRGLLELGEIHPGDFVYEYGTNCPILVENVQMRYKSSSVFKVNYTDGRYQYIPIGENIFNGNRIIALDYILKYPYFPRIRSYEFNPSNINKIKPKLDPDPYVAGALLIYGDYDDPYINLPLDLRGADQLLAHKYNLNFASKLDNNKVYFRWNGIDDDKCIRWNEFFHHRDIYANTKCFNSPLIPNEYLYAPVRDRQKFIMGVFDCGYKIDSSPDIVSISHLKEERLKLVQYILWSLGILSSITYDPNITSSRGRQYKLNILHDYEGYPGMFYDIDAIRNMLYLDPIFKRPIDEFTFRIENIVECQKSFTRSLVLEKPGAIYIGDNFLPIVSN